MNQYLRLLMAREAREVIGKKGANLWILTFVLIATFMSIAFSAGSMDYLRDRMEDPFTNWVNIIKATDDVKFNSFRESLFLDENKEAFGYRSVLMDQSMSHYFQGADTGQIHFLDVRFFESINTPLMKAILNDDNIVLGCSVNSSLLIEKTLGFIITMDAVKKLGYDENYLPTYISYIHGIKKEDLWDVNIDSLGITLILDQYCRIPVPVLAVVRRLPGNVDMVSANFFYDQQHNNDRTHPFDLVGHEATYLHSLIYYVSDEVGAEDFDSFVSRLDAVGHKITIFEDNSLTALQPWKPGTMRVIDLGNDSPSIEVYNEIAKSIREKYDDGQVHRVYDLETKDMPSPRGAFLSIEFETLSKIRAFEDYAKEKGITLDMAQVTSKENFNAVTVIASILSAAMVIFSIICIIMFLVNMLQSYFQKVKRNIGTFKAFGMNSKELIRVYVIILVTIVISGVVLALLITWGIQGLLPLIGIEKDGFNYLSLWNPTTFIATAVIFISTIATVIVVMTRMLSQTPGDLIYDR